MNIDLPELIKAFNSIKPTPDIKIEYRLYYDELGIPVTMSSHAHPAGKYVVVSKEVYDRANYNNLRVVEGKLVEIVNQSIGQVRLKKSNTGFAVVKNHANILADHDTQEEIEYYEYKNH
jgi:hypothetical protein